MDSNPRVVLIGLGVMLAFALFNWAANKWEQSKTKTFTPLPPVANPLAPHSPPIWAVCSLCGNTHFVDCPKCGGIKNVEGQWGDYGGSGLMSTWTCEACLPSGKVPCPNCG